jgi:hypothetical protein
VSSSSFIRLKRSGVAKAPGGLDGYTVVFPWAQEALDKIAARLGLQPPANFVFASRAAYEDAAGRKLPAKLRKQFDAQHEWHDAGPLTLPKEMAVHVARWLREGVLNRQAGFSGSVDIPGLAALDVEWVAAGQTAGAAVWSRDGSVGCVSTLLSGLEESVEREEVLAALAPRRLAVPPDINETWDKFPRPLLTNVHYSLASQTDPVAPMLSHAFFAMLGHGAKLAQSRRRLSRAH